MCRRIPHINEAQLGTYFDALSAEQMSYQDDPWPFLSNPNLLDEVVGDHTSDSSPHRYGPPCQVRDLVKLYSLLEE